MPATWTPRATAQSGSSKQQAWAVCGGVLTAGCRRLGHSCQHGRALAAIQCWRRGCKWRRGSLRCPLTASTPRPLSLLDAGTMLLSVKLDARTVVC